VEWPASFYALRSGEGCPLCEQGRPDETPYGARILAGDVADGYLQRADIQPGYSVVIWRGRHVVEPTELDDAEAAAYWLEVLRVGRALESHFGPVKLNYDVLGNALPHLHMHVVPRYADDPKPGWPFPFPDPEPGPIPEADFRADVAALRALLGQGRSRGAPGTGSASGSPG
jgi:diadenosine tetraphosphate (Ap4A) HIT family hydrolase